MYKDDNKSPISYFYSPSEYPINSTPFDTQMFQKPHAYPETIFLVYCTGAIPQGQAPNFRLQHALLKPNSFSLYTLYDIGFDKLAYRNKNSITI